MDGLENIKISIRFLISATKVYFVPKIKQAQPPNKERVVVSGELFECFYLVNFRYKIDFVTKIKSLHTRLQKPAY